MARRRNTKSSGVNLDKAPEVKEEAVETDLQEEAPEVEEAVEETPEAAPVEEAPVVEKKKPAAPKKTAPKLKEGEFDMTVRSDVAVSIYCERVQAGKPATNEELAQAHYALFLALKDILSKDVKDFKKEWARFLELANANPKTFNEGQVFRGIFNWPTSQSDLSLYRNLMVVALETKDPAKRKGALKAVKGLLEKDILSEDMKNKLSAFYGV